MDINLGPINSSAVSFVLKNGTPLTLMLKDVDVTRAMGEYESFLRTGAPRFGRYGGVNFKNNAEALFEEAVVDFNDVAAVKSLQRIEK
jgi:hypothetical protein